MGSKQQLGVKCEVVIQLGGLPPVSQPNCILATVKSFEAQVFGRFKKWHFAFKDKMALFVVD